MIGRRIVMGLPLAFAFGCSKVPRDVDENDDLAGLRRQVELPFTPSAARWCIRRHASGGSIGIIYAYLVAVMEVAPAEMERLEKQPKATSQALDLELGSMKGDLATRAQRPGAEWRAALPLFQGKKFPTSGISELKIYDDGVVALLLASPSEDF
jgi:hypothetical protein